MKAASGRGAASILPQASSSVRDVGGFIDQRGSLPPEFEQHRRQILGGRSRDDLARAGAAGKEDEIEGELEKLRNLFAVSRHRRDRVRLEILRRQFEQ